MRQHSHREAIADHELTAHVERLPPFPFLSAPAGGRHRSPLQGRDSDNVGSAACWELQHEPAWTVQREDGWAHVAAETDGYVVGPLEVSDLASFLQDRS